jgi:hypothetical protein
MKATHICATCGSVMTPKTHTPGNILVELILWLMLLIPGIIYSCLENRQANKGMSYMRRKGIDALSQPHAARCSRSSSGIADYQ